MERMEVGERRPSHRSRSNELMSMLYWYSHIFTDSIYIKSGSAEGEVPPSKCKKYFSNFHFTFQTLKAFIESFHLSLQRTFLRVLSSSPKEKTDFIISDTSVNRVKLLLIENHHRAFKDTCLPSIISLVMFLRTKFVFDVFEGNDLWALSTSMLMSEEVFLHKIFLHIQMFYYEVFSPLVSQFTCHVHVIFGLFFCLDLRDLFLFYNHPT